jgi:predicted lipoprotein with Yx(FWY)xxD motif
MTTIAGRRETVTMSGSVGIRTPGPIRLGAWLAVAFGAALLTAACGSSGSSSSSAPASSAPAAEGATGSAVAGGGSGLVITTKSGSAGAFLTDGSGRAVYLWMKDGKDSSACSGACAGAWPPVTTTGAVTASGGVNMAGLSTITRPGGAKQVIYDGHPLYYFSGDSGPGQVNGPGSDGFGAKWWLVDPAGTSITAAVTVSSGASPSAPASPAGGGAGGGY